MYASFSATLKVRGIIMNWCSAAAVRLLAFSAANITTDYDRPEAQRTFNCSPVCCSASKALMPSARQRLCQVKNILCQPLLLFMYTMQINDDGGIALLLLLLLLLMFRACRPSGPTELSTASRMPSSATCH